MINAYTVPLLVFNGISSHNARLHLIDACMSDEDSLLLSDYVQSITTNYLNKLKIVHLNAQSLNDTSHQSEFLDTFSNCGIDIITVSETWFRNNDHICLPGYNIYNINRSNSNGGGVAVFIRSCHAVKVLLTSSGDKDRPEYVLLDVLIGSTKIMFAGVYRRPKAGYLNVLMDDIYQYCANYKYFFLCGDINAGFGRGGEDTRAVVEFIELCNLQCVPFEATFHVSNCHSNLDVIASNCPDSLITHGQTPASGFSAHDLIYAVFDISVPRFAKHTASFRNFNGIVTDDLLRDVENAPWAEVYQQSDINSKLVVFNGIISGLMNKHAPNQSKTFKQSSSPWMSNKIRKMISKRNKLRKKFNRSKCQEDLDSFRKMRNQVKQVIRNAKIKYYYTRFDTTQTKDLWSAVRSLNLGKSSGQLPEPVIPINDLNAHYSSVSTVQNESLVSLSVDKYNNLTPHLQDISDKFHFKYVLPGDIYSALNSIKSKATGVDLIPIIFIKKCLPVLLPVLDHLFNFSLQNGSFPDMWKLANIVPIPKTKNPTESKDYRPVSILCVLGKALEKIVHKQMCEFLSQHSLFTSHQSGFRKNHSTVTALVKVADDIRAAIDKKLATLLVLLDLSKAFDCVHHKLLLAKLKYLGFSHSSIKWFQSYLTDRKHRVFVSDSKLSDWADIVTGVPQGSVLGPLLFLIYLFDLPSILLACSYHMYADDIQLYVHFPINHFAACLNMLSCDLSNFIDFCLSHNLVLNIAKTQAIIIGTQRYLTLLEANPVPPLVIKGCTVPFSKKVNNLGVTFDSTLSWSDHCVLLIQKVFGILAQLRRSVSFIPPNIRKLLVSALVMPHLDYASVLLTDISDSNHVKLQRLQNACVRFITGATRFEHITPYYEQLQLSKLEERKIIAIAVLVRKVIKYQTPMYLYEKYKFIPQSDSRSTRSHEMTLQIPIHRTVKFHRSFLIQSSKIWNSLELYRYLRMSDTSFRYRIRSILSGMS